MTRTVSPPAISYGASAEGYHLPLGLAVYRSATGLFLLADASNAAKSPAVGLVYKSSPQNYQIGVINSGFITLNNWSVVIGAVSLTPGALYYLASLPGRLVAGSPPAGAATEQTIGQAVSSITLQVFGNIAFWPQTSTLAGGLAHPLITLDTVTNQIVELRVWDEQVYAATMLQLKDLVTGTLCELTCVDGQWAVTDYGVPALPETPTQLNTIDDKTKKAVAIVIRNGQRETIIT